MHEVRILNHNIPVDTWHQMGQAKIMLGKTSYGIWPAILALALVTGQLLCQNPANLKLATLINMDYDQQCFSEQVGSDREA